MITVSGLFSFSTDLRYSPDAIAGKNNQPWDYLSTGIEMVERQSRLPFAQNRQYLHLKAEYAMRFPRLSAVIRREARSYQISLKQLMMSGFIRAEKIAHDYRWWYKAEVPFDTGTIPPRPYLSGSLF